MHVCPSHFKWSPFHQENTPVVRLFSNGSCGIYPQASNLRDTTQAGIYLQANQPSRHLHHTDYNTRSLSIHSWVWLTPIKLHLTISVLVSLTWINSLYPKSLTITYHTKVLVLTQRSILSSVRTDTQLLTVCYAKPLCFLSSIHGPHRGQRSIGGPWLVRGTNHGPPYPSTLQPTGRGFPDWSEIPRDCSLPFARRQ